MWTLFEMSAMWKALAETLQALKAFGVRQGDGKPGGDWYEKCMKFADSLVEVSFASSYQSNDHSDQVLPSVFSLSNLVYDNHSIMHQRLFLLKTMLRSSR